MKIGAAVRVGLRRQIGEKIAWARAQALQIERLRADPNVAAWLVRLEQAQRASRTAMADSGMIAICGECEERGGGSCCGAGIEDRYDGVTLLINLMLGAELPRERRAEADCFFLGDQGCRLAARHVLCVNYLCEQLAEKFEPGHLAALRELEGRELEATFRLHARLTALLDAQSPSPGLGDTLSSVARFYDQRPVGQVGPEGYRRTTVLADLTAALPRLLELGAVVPGLTRFVDIGCGDGRVSVWASLLVGRAVGIEIEDWALEEGNTRLAELVEYLGRPAPALAPAFFCGDSLADSVWREIERATNLSFADFDLFYTFLCLHQEVGALMSECARPGAFLWVYGLDSILPEIHGLERLVEPELLRRRIVLYRKPWE